MEEDIREKGKASWTFLKPWLHRLGGALIIVAVLAGLVTLWRTTDEVVASKKADKQAVKTAQKKFKAAAARVVKLDTLRRRDQKKSRQLQKVITYERASRDSITTAYNEKKLAAAGADAVELHGRLSIYKPLQVAPPDTSGF